MGMQASQVAPWAPCPMLACCVPLRTIFRWWHISYFLFYDRVQERGWQGRAGDLGGMAPSAVERKEPQKPTEGGRGARMISSCELLEARGHKRQEGKLASEK